jgi:hypothetical protein
MSGQFWSIAGIPVRVTDSTRVQSDVPIAIGTTVEVTGIIAPDGTRVATDVSAGTALDSATPAGTPTSSRAATGQEVVSLPFVAVAATSMVPRPTATPLPQTALQTTLDNLNGLRATINTKPNRDRLDQAIQHLSTSLTPALWIDSTHLQRPTGEKVFAENKEAVNRLRDLMNEQKTASPLVVLQSFVDQIRNADRGLASQAIQEATKTGAGQAATDRAQYELAKGDGDTTLGHSDSAIDHYRNAWLQVVTGRG